jgi:hypothetical protein
MVGGVGSQELGRLGPSFAQIIGDKTQLIWVLPLMILATSGINPSQHEPSSFDQCAGSNPGVLKNRAHGFARADSILRLCDGFPWNQS